jgi:hypothetical protein
MSTSQMMTLKEIVDKLGSTHIAYKEHELLIRAVRQLEAWAIKASGLTREEWIEWTAKHKRLGPDVLALLEEQDNA